jgi:hypothetical protein
MKRTVKHFLFETKIGDWLLASIEKCGLIIVDADQVK